ncbi:MAG: hypothetical protein K0U98_27395 [Deltaproteobacteria bacterium]|nr:hypothetical protein [Deltaproteobacteria bacterium]
MKHSEARLWLGDFLQGHLQDPLHSRLEEHLSRCQRCRHWCETYRLLQTQWAPKIGAGEHCDSEALTWYALAPGELPEPERLAVAAHLEECAACVEEAHLSRQAVASNEPAKEGPAIEKLSKEEPTRENARERSSFSAHRWWPARSAAAALGFLVLGLGFWLGSQYSSAPPLGIVDLHLLEAPLRGSERPTRLEIPEAAPFLLLGLSLDLRTLDPLEESVTFSMVAAEDSSVAPDGRLYWQTRAERLRLERELASNGVVTVALPVEKLEEGPAQLVVAGAGGEAVMTYRLEIVRR